MNILTVAGAALNQTPIDWKNNLANIKAAIAQAQQQRVDILCLPELCITGYTCEDLFLSKWLPETAFDKLLEITEYTANICVSVGLPVQVEGKLYNCSCVIFDGHILGFTPKQFLANDGVHYEHRWFEAGKQGLVTTIVKKDISYSFGDIIYIIKGIRIGFEICEDAWRGPKRPGYNLFNRGVDLILNPSASPFAFGKSVLREELVNQASSEFSCGYIYANLLGNESGRLIFDGEIFISVKGKIIRKNQRFTYQSVNLVTANIDFIDKQVLDDQELVSDSREINEEFAAAVSLGLFDYLRKSRSQGFVLSLSGGADSSSCAVLIAEMVRRATKELGEIGFCAKMNLAYSLVSDSHSLMSQILTCAYQGTQNSTDDTFGSAQELALSIGATFYEWEIDDQVELYTKTVEHAIGRNLTWEQDDITLQNIQARTRAPIIWMLANLKNALLITTSNRSEGDVGYATMDGDTAGSIAPIAGVDKPFIRQWLIWAERELGYSALGFVNDLSPSAELRPIERTQTDEVDLMPYDVLKAIEIEAIRNRKLPIEVFEIVKARKLENDDLLKIHIKKFFRLWSRNQWKRERIAPSFHLDDFNVDPRSWCRFPILSGGFEEELEKIQ